MDIENTGTVARDDPASVLARLALAPFDMLFELDLARERVRVLRFDRGKYRLPGDAGPARDALRYAATYVVHADDRDDFLAFNKLDTLAQRLSAPEARDGLRGRFRFRPLSGGWIWVEETLVAGAENGIPDGTAYLFVVDVEAQVSPGAAEADTNVLRSRLTGLLLESTFFARGRDMLRDRQGDWCLIAIDLEHFKLFNEWYGRDQGDLLLKQVGARLLFAEETADGLAGYFGQDDFCLLAPYHRDRIDALFDSIHALIVRQGTSVGFMPAFGVAQARPDDTIEELYDHAALAARRAKDSYRSRIRMFDPSMYEKTERDYRILSDFQKAISDHELYILFQPQCHISTERVVGAESLVRWRKADGTLVPPGMFVPVLEKYGFITDLDKYVWEEVCLWQKRWIDSGHTPLPISVNVSQMDIFTIDVPDYFARLIARHGLPPDALKIDITESAYVDNDSVADAVRRLREKGFPVLMDDFGSGYSSLNMLRDLNVDIIKLDAKFLRMDGGDRKGLQIMESIVNMARSLGVPIIVEGVETRQESDFLSGLGCRYVQGYYFYRPMPPSEFERLIADPDNIDMRGFRFKPLEQFSTREFLDGSVFSDAMLNNVLGPLAFFVWHGDALDVLRFNQQFLDEVEAPDLPGLMEGVQHAVLPEDRSQLYGFLEQAMNDPLGGAGGMIRLRRGDGRVAQYRVRFFFLDEDEGGRRFYGSIHNVTQMLRLSDQMYLLTSLSPDTVVFLSKTGTELTFQVATHGLEQVLGLSRENLEHELYDGRFRDRMDPAERERLLHVVVDAGMHMDGFSFPFRVKTADGREVRLQMRFDSVHDAESGVEYLMLLREKRD